LWYSLWRRRKFPIRKKLVQGGCVLPLTSDNYPHHCIRIILYTNVLICRARARLYRFVIRRGIQLTPLMLPNLPSHRIRGVVYTRTIFLKGDTILRISGPSTYTRKRACVRVLVFPFSPSFCRALYIYWTFAPPTLKSIRSTRGHSGRALMFAFFRCITNTNIHLYGSRMYGYLKRRYRDV